MIMKFPTIKESEILDIIERDIRLGNIHQKGVWIRINEVRDNWGTMVYHFGANPPCHQALVCTPEMLATVLFDLSMECKIWKFERIRGTAQEKSIAGFGVPVVGYDIYVGRSHDHQTNITGELVETFVELVEDSLEYQEKEDEVEI